MQQTEEKIDKHGNFPSSHSYYKHSTKNCGKEQVVLKNTQAITKVFSRAQKE